ncbi:MAG: hypothetical protein ACR2PZ_02035 [Pseudomonadales bacterium]
MADDSDPQASAPEPEPERPKLPPKTPPKLHPAFLLVWVLAIGAFIVLAGCTLMLLAYALEGGISIWLIIGVLVMAAALYGFVKSLVRARHAELERQPPNKVLLYALLLPLLASLVWGAGCMLAFAGS